MSASIASGKDATGSQEQLRLGREILQAEGQALLDMAGQLGQDFCSAVDRILACRGAVLVVGMGKAGHIGRKLSATLASTGTASHFVHPAEAFHGDLGRFQPDDLALILSQSGETAEIVQILPALADFGVPIIAITGSPESTLARAAAVTLVISATGEACSLGLAPSTTTTAMLALGDALALVASGQRGFRAEDFARYHPGGSLGWRLSKVSDHMRPLSQCRVAEAALSIRSVITLCTKPGRRTGAVMLTGRDGKLTGLFTDSDLVRLLEHRREDALDRPIGEVMTRLPITVQSEVPMSDALAILSARRISELPVVDCDGRPCGLIDITDLAGPWSTDGLAIGTDRDEAASSAEEASGSAEDEQRATLPFRRGS